MTVCSACRAGRHAKRQAGAEIDFKTFINPDSLQRGHGFTPEPAPLAGAAGSLPVRAHRLFLRHDRHEHSASRPVFNPHGGAEGYLEQVSAAHKTCLALCARPCCTTGTVCGRVPSQECCAEFCARRAAACASRVEHGPSDFGRYSGRSWRIYLESR